MDSKGFPRIGRGCISVKGVTYTRETLLWTPCIGRCDRFSWRGGTGAHYVARQWPFSIWCS